jgi:membrane protease subunit (stomatin/prohibitin family)
LTSPLRAEVYFINMKLFPNLKWGTRDPVAFRDSELGLIRLRAHGVFNIRVIQPLLFINSLVGTQGIFTTDEIADYLSQVIVSRFNDLMGSIIDTVLNLPGKYEQLSDGLIKRLQDDFTHYGIALTELYINAITPPPEVQKAIDDKSRLGVFDDLNRLLKMKAAMALEKVAESEGGAGAALGVGAGFMMPALFAEYLKSGHSSENGLKCPDCQGKIGEDARFCPHCGHQLMVFNQCAQCGKNLPPHAKFCSRCGQAVTQGPSPKICPHCKANNLPDSVYCNECGDKI